MDKRKKWPVHLAAGALVTVTLLGVAFAAGQQGTQTDPLVTLSYLTGKTTPEILTQVDAKVTAREKALTDALGAAANGYIKQLEDKLSAVSGSGTAGGTANAAFTVVDVPAGKKLVGGVGCEIMLRVGNATCYTPSSPGLIDMTDGTTLESGGAMVKNHLYMVTVADRGLSAKDAVKVLVRGSYTIQ